MERKKTGWKQRLTLFLVSSLIVVALLGIGELYCRWFTRINFLDNSRGLFVANRYGKSYGNTPNYEGFSFGEAFYTDENGFRIDPQFKSSAAENAPAILILGDSVAFGPAVQDNLTIAGRLRKAMPNKRIYNASTIGYDTLDYKNAADSIIANKPEIREVLLFFCLNDLNDASAQQIRYETNSPGEPVEPLDRSPLRAVNDYLRSRSKLYLWLKNAMRDTQMVYFKNDLSFYQKGEKYVGDGLQPLRDLKRQLDASGISLKVFILPYEAQLRPDSPKEFLLPQKLISDVLRQSEIEYYDLAPEFQKSGADSHYLFLYGDPMHLSEGGNKLAAEIVCGKIPDCKSQ